jgi:S-(hydroxymethyl)glutathione dehydrogenase / alcohol dehydrogenase
MRGVSQPLTVEDVEVDHPRAHEVCIRTAATGLCHSDLSVLTGGGFGSLPPPAILGHESAGVVEAVGSGVSYVRKGDHVVACVSAFCGVCDYCLSGRPYLCGRAGLGRSPGDRPRVSVAGATVATFASIGGFAERLLVHENALVKVDQSVPFEVAALFGCGITTGLGAAVNAARVEAGSTCAILGCGGVGLAVIQGCRLAGARAVIGIDRLASRLEYAEELGATALVAAGEGDPVEKVMSLTNGGVDYAFEVVGSAETAQQSLAMTRPGGVALLVGGIPDDFPVSGRLLTFDRTLRGCLVGSNRFRIDVPRWLELYRSGRLALDRFVTNRIALDGINEGCDGMGRGDGIRTVIVFG